MIADLEKVQELLFGRVARMCGTLSLEAQALDIRYDQLAEYLEQYAAGAFVIAEMMCTAAFSQVKSLVAQGWRPVSALDNIAFDETPLWMRVPSSVQAAPVLHPALPAPAHDAPPPDAPPPHAPAADEAAGPPAPPPDAPPPHAPAAGEAAGPPGTKQRPEKMNKVVAKIMQCDADCAFLLKNADQFVMISIPLPSTIQVVDHYTAETVAACIDKVFKLTSGAGCSNFRCFFSRGWF